MTKQYIMIVVAALLLATSGDAVSQTDTGLDKERGERTSHRRMPGRGFGDPSMMIERMAEHLDLDDLQRQSIANIIEAAKPEFESVRSQSRDNRAAIRALDVDDPSYGASLQDLAARSGELATELMLLTGRIRAEVADVLTDEQRATLEEKLSRMGERRRHFSPDRAR